MEQSFKTAGMHCKSCEIILKENIEELPGVTVVSVSYKKNKLEVEFQNENDREAIEEIITASGYAPNRQKNTLPLMLRFVFLTLALTLFVIFLQLVKIFPSFGQSGEISFVLAFFVGLLASISTCFAVTGGIIIGYTENLIDTSNGFLTQLKFQAGRILAFLLGGAILGGLGSIFQISLSFTVILNIIVGYILLQMGLKGIGLFPHTLSLGLYMPGKVLQYINTLKHPRFAPIVGMLTFFLPCGFTQSMQVLAISSGSPLMGMMILGAFALGTFPVLFGIGVGVEFIKDKLKFLNPLISVLLIVFGLFTLVGGISLVRALIPTGNFSQDREQTETSVSENLETEIVEVGHNGSQFVPSPIRLKQGKNYILRVIPESDGIGCMFALAYNGKTYYIKKGEIFDLEVDGSRVRKIPLVCASMGMRQGEIIVE